MNVIILGVYLLPLLNSLSEYLRLHRNNFSGTVDSKICDLFSTNLVQFYADCKNDLDIDALPEVECPCCTDCCDPGKFVQRYTVLTF